MYSTGTRMYMYVYIDVTNENIYINLNPRRTQSGEN